MKFSILILSYLILISCGNNKKFEQAKFDQSISKQKVNADTLGPDEMYKLNDPPSVFDDNFVGKTSTVNYCIINDKEGTFLCSDYYQCHAFFDSSKLIIDIGLNSLNGGSGLTIEYLDENFFVSPYSWKHLPDQSKPDIEIKAQKLVLNKRQYKIGDSLYGRVYCHALVSEYGESREHLTQGYFRAKIARSPIIRGLPN